jgi:hypothetical protein
MPNIDIGKFAKNRLYNTSFSALEFAFASNPYLAQAYGCPPSVIVSSPYVARQNGGGGYFPGPNREATD